MNMQQDVWDERFGELLTRSYGNVNADEEFRAGLLVDLKRVTTWNEVADESGEKNAENRAGDDAKWSRLLKCSYVSCEPRVHFKNCLLDDIRNRQAAIQAETKRDSNLKTMLDVYDPVRHRLEFKTRLLDNLKERQRSTTVMRTKSRNRAIFLSAFSSMVAAAMVVFVVWVQPLAPTANPQSMAGAGVIAASDNNYTPPEPSFQNASINAESAASMATAGPATASSGGGYRVSEVFRNPSLPDTMRGVDMEINDGEGWKRMDETLIASVTPGVALRPRPDAATSGLGFGDGSTIHMLPDSIIEATGNGFAVRRGAMTVNVPNNSDSRFFLHFPERDVALEPGTMLAVTVEPEERYAKGGAPAPVVKILDGGMAVTRGKAGNGILLANQAYHLDNYVTPDLPGRPLCAAECAELEKAMLARSAPEVGYAPARMVSDERGTAAFRSSPNGYVKSGNRWIADSYDGETPTVRIQYLSDGYFGFANAHRELAGALALGPEVVIDGGDGVFYEIFR